MAGTKGYSGAEVGRTVLASSLLFATISAVTHLLLLLLLPSLYKPQIVALCQEAALCAMHEDINTKEVAWRHFEQALRTIKPQTRPSMVAFYETYSKTSQ